MFAPPRRASNPFQETPSFYFCFGGMYPKYQAGANDYVAAAGIRASVESFYTTLNGGARPALARRRAQRIGRQLYGHR